MSISDVEQEAAKELSRLLLGPIVKAMANSGVRWVVLQVYKHDKGRNQPFWTKQWRGTK